MAAQEGGGFQLQAAPDTPASTVPGRDQSTPAQPRPAVPKSRTCSYCGENGHYRTTCPKLASGGGTSEWFSAQGMSSLRGCTECGRVDGHKKSCSLSVYEAANRMYPMDSPYREPEARPRDFWKPVETTPQTPVTEGAGKPRYCGACGQAGHYRKTCPHPQGTWLGAGAAPAVAPLPMAPPLVQPNFSTDSPPVAHMDARKELEMAMPKPVVVDRCPSCQSTSHCHIGCDIASRPPPPPPLPPEPSQVQDWPPAPRDWRRPADGGDRGWTGVPFEGSFDSGSWAGNGGHQNGRPAPWQHEQDDWIARSVRKMGDTPWAGPA